MLIGLGISDAKDQVHVVEIDPLFQNVPFLAIDIDRATLVDRSVLFVASPLALPLAIREKYQVARHRWECRKGERGPRRPDNTLSG